MVRGFRTIDLNVSFYSLQRPGLLPRTTSDAVKLARSNDERVAGRTWIDVDRNRRLRHALEVRHASFVTPRFVELLREQGIALVVADTAGRWPFLEDVTSDFVYVRLHGEVKLCESGYTDAALECWSARIKAWRDGCTPPDAPLAAAPPARAAPPRLHVYFDNDVKVHAPFDA